MYSRFQLQIHRLLGLHSSLHAISNPLTPCNFFNFLIPFQHYHLGNFPNNCQLELSNQFGGSIDHEALKIKSLLQLHSHQPVETIEQALNECNLSLSEDLILNVLKRHGSEWKSAYVFFNWVCKTKNSNGLSPDTSIYNEIVDILGRMRRFDEVQQVLDKMSSRKNLINEHTYAIVVNRLSAAHRVEEAIGIFNRMEYFGLERNLITFQRLLLSLCRYKHVEEAELLFRNRKSEFRDDIKTWNIILNGWCLLRSLPDAKRFWKDILRSEIKPDKFTYGIFINALCKSGKVNTAAKLLEGMWEKGAPDVTICNAVIDGLCFKKSIPMALGIFNVMHKRNCPPNIASYNSLIKHLCKIQRMDKVHELLNEMEENVEFCSPNALTYGYLLKASRNPEEVERILKRMEKRGCKMHADTYNLLLRLFVKWGDEERVKCIWDEMKRSGLGPDQRSYTIIIHGLYDKGISKVALDYFSEMISKGMIPEPRTKLLVDEMKFKLNEID